MERGRNERGRTVRIALGMLALCGGMLAAYYGAAALTGGVYGGAYIAGWSLAALCVPAAAWVVWQAWRPGIWGRCVGAGVIGAALLLSRVLFDGPRVYDWIIAAALAWLLFRRR